MNKLTKLKEFQQILADYNVSQTGQKILEECKLVLLAAPTSAGRNVIIRELLKTNNYHYVVSDTTRQPRINDGIMEQNGVEYWFRSESQMLKELKQGKLFEAAIIHNQQVSGLSIRELLRAKKEGRIAVTDIEIVGVKTIINMKPQSVCLFILPPNFKEWQRRIMHRGLLPGKEKKRRMQSACKEFEAALANNQYYFVINDTVNNAVQEIDRFARLGQVDKELQEKGKELAKKLLQDSLDYLKRNES